MAALTIGWLVSHTEMGVFPTKERWKVALVLAAITMGAVLGTVSHSDPGVAVVKPEDQLQRELFDAILKDLEKHHLQRRDLPERILSVKEVSPDRYLVQMKMHEGVAWFTIWWEGGEWRVQGSPPPR